MGSKPVIVGSLTAMVAVGLVLLVLSGPLAFWVCGLLLGLFLGPTQVVGAHDAAANVRPTAGKGWRSVSTP